LQGWKDKFVLMERGQDDNLRARTDGLYPASGFDAIHTRHHQVHENYIRDEFLG
jgi:hypothetical protein